MAVERLEGSGRDSSSRLHSYHFDLTFHILSQRQPTRNFQQPQDLSLSPQPSVFNFSPSIASAFLRSAALRQESDENADRTELTIVSN